ncbi:MAG: hypothetical protein F6J86_18825 [Symploca sp. SIO1B1]|nr:hypothetical protein [Symploca sp. SIO1B1]
MQEIDGANAGISFSRDGQMLLQSQEHYLTVGVINPTSPVSNYTTYRVKGALRYANTPYK